MDTKQEPKSCARIEGVGITTGRDGLPAEAEGRIQIQADEYTKTRFWTGD